jgi:phosphate transport system ATP-binding protein
MPGNEVIPMEAPVVIPPIPEAEERNGELGPPDEAHRGKPFPRDEVRTAGPVAKGGIRNGVRPPTEERLDDAAIEAILRVREFSLFYGQTQALKKVSLDIHPRAVTAIIGPSGCGKSTLLRSFNRMNDLIPGIRTEGEITLRDLNLRAATTDVVDLRRRIGMVFQRPNPFPKSIFDNVVFGLRMLGLRNRAELEARAEESLRRAALWEEVKDSLGRSALALSGGQQQRLCIARCLAVQPEIILMDEPTSALDPAATARIEELLIRLKANYTIVIVTHNMQQAARVSSFSAFLLNGELIEYDETIRIFTNPRVQATEDYITGRFG